MKPILTMDFETDPFSHGVEVHPFACGLYDGNNYASVWSKQCAAKMVRHLETLEPSIIYMHNGGRFDIFFLMKWLEPEMQIINGRIVRAYLGKHEIRDSFAILPVALAAYKKDDIDITKLHRDCRDQHRDEIMSYLRGDCVYLHELVTAFWSEFGDYLTIGSAAMAQLKKFHPFEAQGKFNDETFRSRFFFGGRVQCLQSGVIDTPFKIYDVNSMYPHVMKNFVHPTGAAFLDRVITKKTHFVVAEGINRGAFPQRNQKGGIDFTDGRGTYHTTIHEWNAALETGMFKPTKILKTFNFDEEISFGEYIEHFYNARLKAKKEKNKILDLFYKLILNSSYGKFAQNPLNFADWAITPGGRTMPSPWTPHAIHRDPTANGVRYAVWKKGVERHSYYNVAIGASITGAARSILMRALAVADNPIYCDTDSITCRSLPVEKSETELGAWKLEASGNRIAIAGKKMYACFDGETCIKSATKGARLPPADIMRVAQGETVRFKKDAPTFKLDGRVQFIARDIRRTV